MLNHCFHIFVYSTINIWDSSILLQQQNSERSIRLPSFFPIFPPPELEATPSFKPPKESYVGASPDHRHYSSSPLQMHYSFQKMATLWIFGGILIHDVSEPGLVDPCHSLQSCVFLQSQFLLCPVLSQLMPWLLGSTWYSKQPLPYFLFLSAK